MLGRGMAEAGQRNLDCETYEAATASAKQGLKNATVPIARLWRKRKREVRKGSLTLTSLMLRFGLGSSLGSLRIRKENGDRRLGARSQTSSVPMLPKSTCKKT